MGFFRRLLARLGFTRAVGAGHIEGQMGMKPKMKHDEVRAKRLGFREHFVTRCPACGNGGHARRFAYRKAIGRVLRMKEAAARS